MQQPTSRSAAVRRALTPLVLALLAGVPLRADTLMTTDGRIIDGPPMERGEEGVTIHFEHGDVFVPEAMVHELFIDADLEALPKKERRKLEKELADRRAEIEEAQAHSTWGSRYHAKTKNFEWEYTLPEHMAEGLKVRFEAYYAYFAKLWRLKRNRREKPMLVNFYRDSKQYQRVAGAPPGALAYFKFVGRYDLNACYDRLDPVETEMVLYHELSHYVQKLIDEKFNMPHWPGEGVAEYYGGSLYDPETRKLRVGLIQDGRLAEVKSDISLDKYLSIREIVTKPAYTDYTWGWALVHFFKSDKKMSKAFDRYLLGLAREKGVHRVLGAFGLKTVEGEESLRFLLECLGLEESDLPELEKRFYAYIENDLKFESSHAKEKAATAAQRVGKRLRALRLFKEAEEAGGLSAMGCYNYARLLRYEDKGKAKQYLKRAIELDPLVATFYFDLGRLFEDDDEEESARLIGLAKELDPDVESWVIDIEFEGNEEDE